MSILQPLLLSAALLGAPEAAVQAPDTLFALGRSHGLEDAQEAPVRGDFVRGLGWSLLLGPVGGVVAVRRTSNAPPSYPDARRNDFVELGGEYQSGYEDAYHLIYPPRRREATLVGTMIGSLTFAFIMLKVFDLPSRSRIEGELPDDDPVVIRIPLPR